MTMWLERSGSVRARANTVPSTDPALLHSFDANRARSLATRWPTTHRSLIAFDWLRVPLIVTSSQHIHVTRSLSLSLFLSPPPNESIAASGCRPTHVTSNSSIVIVSTDRIRQTTRRRLTDRETRPTSRCYKDEREVVAGKRETMARDSDWRDGAETEERRRRREKDEEEVAAADTAIRRTRSSVYNGQSREETRADERTIIIDERERDGTAAVAGRRRQHPPETTTTTTLTNEDRRRGGARKCLCLQWRMCVALLPVGTRLPPSSSFFIVGWHGDETDSPKKKRKEQEEDLRLNKRYRIGQITTTTTLTTTTYATTHDDKAQWASRRERKRKTHNWLAQWY